MKNLWAQFYRRRAFFEGMASTFDLFGENSSFKKHFFQYNDSNNMKSLVNSIGQDFYEVGQTLKHSIRNFENNYVRTK